MKNKLSEEARKIVRNIQRDILPVAIGFVLGIMVAVLSTSHQLNHLKEEYHSYRKFVDSCLLNPDSTLRIPAYSRYEEEDYYQQVFRK